MKKQLLQLLLSSVCIFFVSQAGNAQAAGKKTTIFTETTFHGFR